MTEADVAAMGEREVMNLIFLPGFSTADQVSDLSGRGVGMDVVRTNISRMNGSIELDSEPGREAVSPLSFLSPWPSFKPSWWKSNAVPLRYPWRQ